MPAKVRVATLIRIRLGKAPAYSIDMLVTCALVKMTAVGFEPTHPKMVELESTALDHSAKLSMLAC